MLLLVLAVFGLLAIRAWDSQRGPPLAVWHTYAPDDLTARDIEKLDWDGYLKAENALFEEVRTKLAKNLKPEQRVASNRYFDGSPIYPGKFKVDWNRSYVLEPEGAPVGAVVLLHGLTDSPYSLRHIARRTGRTATSRSRSGCRPTARFPARSRRSTGRTGRRPPASRSERRAAASARRGRCIWSASRTAARSR